MLEKGKDELRGEADVVDMLISGDAQENKRRKLEAKSAVGVYVEKFGSANVHFSGWENFKLNLEICY